MQTLATTLHIAGCAIFFLLGLAHWIFTFRGNRFDPRDPELKLAMQRVSPVLTRQTTMWKAWVGFNASHSLGAMLYGLFFIALAIENPAYLRDSVLLVPILFAVPATYLVLAYRYWFSVPRRGIVVASLLIVAAFVIRAAH